LKRRQVLARLDHSQDLPKRRANEAEVSARRPSKPRLQPVRPLHHPDLPAAHRKAALRSSRLRPQLKPARRPNSPSDRGDAAGVRPVHRPAWRRTPVVRRPAWQDRKAGLTGRPGRRLVHHRPPLLNHPAVVVSLNAVAARGEIASTDGTQIPAFTLWKTLRYL
jgi:hypothetical protein